MDEKENIKQLREQRQAEERELAQREHEKAQ